MAPGGVLLSRCILCVGRHFVRVLHRQRRGEHEHRVRSRGALAGKRDPRNPRVQRQSRKFATERGQAIRVVERAQCLQHAIGLGDVTPVGRIDPGKCGDVAESEVGHLQDHAGEIGALDFRIGEQRTREKVILLVEPHADAGAETTAAAGALVGGRL